MAPSDPSPQNHAPPAAATEPAGFARLARRLTAWTSNLLATGMVLALALGGGGQLVRWYQEEPLPSHLAVPQQAATNVAPEVELTGGGYALRRDRVRGSERDAIARLVTFCRGALQQPIRSGQHGSASQRRFLAAVADRQPAAEARGEWRIYEFEGLMPMVVGVRDQPLATHGSGQPLASDEGRVLAWGIAVPSGQNAWHLYQYSIASDAATSLSEAFPIALPVGARRTLAVADSGQRTMGLAGPGSPEAWRRHFDQQFHHLVWTSVGWQSAGGGWHARYESADGQSAEVHFAQRDEQQLLGLVIVTGGATRHK